MDTAEAKRHERYLLAGGEEKKYKGVPPARDQAAPRNDPFSVLFNMIKTGRKGVGGIRGSAAEVAMVKGKVYKNVETGEITDANGNPVKPGPGMVFKEIPTQKGS
jgi:hypothetical protein